MSYPARQLGATVLHFVPWFVAVSRPGRRIEFFPEFVMNYLFVLAAWAGAFSLI